MNDDLEDYVPIEVAAKRMCLTVVQVKHLCACGALRAFDLGDGLHVQPAILSGWRP